MSIAIDVLKKELDAATERAVKVKEDTREDISQGERARRRLDDANLEAMDLQAALTVLTDAIQGVPES